MPHSAADNEFRLQTLDSVELRLSVAGVGARSYAFIIDWHIRAIAAALWGFGGLKLAGNVHADGRIVMFTVGLPATLIYIGYHPVLEVLQRGLTPGKRLAGLRIVNQQGGPPGFGALLIRNLFRVIDSLPVCYGIGLLMMMASPRQARFGDIAAGTMVVYDTAVNRKAARTEDLLSNRSADPQLLMLADELLRRWDELEPDPRRVLSAKLLERAGRPVPESDATRRAALQALKDGRP